LPLTSSTRTDDDDDDDEVDCNEVDSVGGVPTSRSGDAPSAGDEVEKLPTTVARRSPGQEVRSDHSLRREVRSDHSWARLQLGWVTVFGRVYHLGL